MASKGKILKRLTVGCGSLVVIGFAMLFFTRTGKDIRNLWSHGFADAYLSADDERKYNASAEANLKAMYTALMMYHESEGAFPPANRWMDALKNYGAASDLAKGESEKKFVSPSLAGRTGAFGYAINEAVAGKYKGDIKDPKTPFIFDSTDTARNAHGDPKRLMPSPPRPGGNRAIAVDGTIVKL
jgi:hypothetical protein